MSERESDDGVDDRRGRGAGANVKRALRRAQAHRRAVQGRLHVIPQMQEEGPGP